MALDRPLVRLLSSIAAALVLIAASPLLADNPVDPRQHWAFQPIVAPLPPAIDDAFIGACTKKPIDAFIAAPLARANLRPAPVANR